MQIRICELWLIHQQAVQASGMQLIWNCCEMRDVLKPQSTRDHSSNSSECSQLPCQRAEWEISTIRRKSCDMETLEIELLRSCLTPLEQTHTTYRFVSANMYKICSGAVPQDPFPTICLCTRLHAAQSSVQPGRASSSLPHWKMISRKTWTSGNSQDSVLYWI